MSGTDQAASVLGHGHYSVSSASRLAGVSARKARNWVAGYQRGGVHYPPVWTPRYVDAEGPVALSFLDLQQLRFVDHMRRLGASLQSLRLAHDRARSRWGLDYPFASKRIRRLGRTLFLDIAPDDATSPVLVEILSDQRAWHEVLEPFLQGLDYGKVYPVRWRPTLSGKRHSDAVVLDPEYSFGRPVTLPSRQETRVLAAQVAAGDSADSVAWWYGVSRDEVAAAVAFETMLSEAKRAA